MALASGDVWLAAGANLLVFEPGLYAPRKRQRAAPVTDHCATAHTLAGRMLSRPRRHSV